MSDFLENFMSFGSPKNLEDLLQLDPRKFDEFIAFSLLPLLGYSNIQLSKLSYDSGYDISAYKDEKLILFECKRWSSPVGVKPVRDLADACSRMKASEGIFIATSDFSSHVFKEQESRELKIEFWNGSFLNQLLKDDKYLKFLGELGKKRLIKVVIYSSIITLTILFFFIYPIILYISAYCLSIFIICYFIHLFESGQIQNYINQVISRKSDTLYSSTRKVYRYIELLILQIILLIIIWLIYNTYDKLFDFQLGWLISSWILTFFSGGLILITKIYFFFVYFDFKL